MVTVTVRQQNPDIRIVARCAEELMADKLVRAGANAAVSPSVIGGMRLASELVRPHVVSFLDVMLREKSKTCVWKRSSSARDRPGWDRRFAAQELDRHFDLLMLALRKPDGGTTFNPHGDTVIAPEDVLVVMGDVNQIWRARGAAGSA